MSGEADDAEPARFFRPFLRLAIPFFTAAGQWWPRLVMAALILVVFCQVALAVLLNVWSANLFDALESRSTEGATRQIGIFVLIVLGTMAVNSAHLLARRALQMGWRRWLTDRLFRTWMDDAHHYQASLIPGNHANPDGRIAEDVRIATEGAVDLASSLLFCVLHLMTFVGILWSLSGWIPLFGVLLPGHLVVLAFLYAGTGAVVAFLLGRPLVRATDMRQTMEADFRYGLVQSRESAEPIALARGERAERGRLALLFEAIAPAWRNQSIGLARIAVFSSGYSVLAGVLPLLVGTWRFLDGSLSLGGLVQSAQAFQQVSISLSWPIDNLPRIAEWRASVERVLALEEAVQTVALEAARRGDTAINLNRSPDAPLGFRGLWVAAPDGTAMLSDLSLQVVPGEHVLLNGDPEAAAALFRVLAGIWPWGRGHVDLPADSAMCAIGRRPFLPAGALRQVLAFPADPARYGDAAIADALVMAGLEALAARLDDAQDWSRILGLAEQQRLSFARVILQTPDWIVLGDATDALEPDCADAMLRLIRDVLPGAGVIVIGRHPGSAETFTRHMTLDRAPDGEVLLNEVYARRHTARMSQHHLATLVEWLQQGFRS